MVAARETEHRPESKWGSNLARLTSIGGAPTPNGSTALKKKFKGWGTKRSHVSLWGTQTRTGRRECTGQRALLHGCFPLNTPFGLNGLTAVASKTMLLARNTGHMSLCSCSSERICRPVQVSLCQPRARIFLLLFSLSFPLFFACSKMSKIT